MRISDWSSDVCSSDLSRNRMLATIMACALLGACSTVEDAPKGEAAYAAIPPAPAVGVDYRISPDDILRIQVYHEPGLSLEDAQVTAAGMVRMPLIGDVSIAGLERKSTRLNSSH